jgi:aminopeptidase N
MVPLMMDDFKPSIWPVSNKNLTNNDQIIDYLSIHIYSKGASLLRLLEYIAGPETFQTAVQSLYTITDISDLYTTFYSNFDLNSILNTATTVEEFLGSWLEEKNYPIVTIDFTPGNGTEQNTTIVFRQTRYPGSFILNHSLSNPDYAWKIYMECDLGGIHDGDDWNFTANYSPSKIKFLFESSTETIQLDEDYIWIKCNKDFYSYQVTEYISSGDYPYLLWEYFELIFNEEIFSNNDKANLLNDAFVLPHGGEIATYDQAINLVREMFTDPPSFYIPWSVFVWHWNYVMGVEEHSKYFWNFKVKCLINFTYFISSFFCSSNLQLDRF